VRFRQKLKKSKSRKLFRKTSGTHRKNIAPRVMRGGFRL
jgi:hypothetical protein